MKHLSLLVTATCLSALGAACSSTGGGNTFQAGGAGGAGAIGGNGGSGAVIGTGGGGGNGTGGKLGTTPPCNSTDPNADADGDGFTPAAGDCNDCTDQMNPGAYDYAGNGVDEDCNGTPDDEPTGCDTQTFDIGYGDPMVAAQAIGLCRVAQGSSWGVVSAKYVKADGSPGMNDVSHGLLPSFGPNVQPRDGTNMLGLSSGTARRPGDALYQSPGGADMGTTGTTPPGFPIDSPACTVQTASDTTTNDPAAFEIVVRTPTNANQMAFDFNFYTFEFPVYVCSIYNDFFVALVDPAPQNAQSGNVSFDSQGNPVSVNNGFLEVCAPQSAGGKNFPCQLGTAGLDGTGFEGHAATGWLNTQAPVPKGKEIRIRFAIWDMGDHVLDSTVLIDNFTWDVGQGEPPTTQPVK